MYRRRSEGCRGPCGGEPQSCKYHGLAIGTTAAEDDCHGDSWESQIRFQSSSEPTVNGTRQTVIHRHPLRPNLARRTWPSIPNVGWRRYWQLIARRRVSGPDRRPLAPRRAGCLPAQAGQPATCDVDAEACYRRRLAKHSQPPCMSSSLLQVPVAPETRATLFGIGFELPCWGAARTPRPQPHRHPVALCLVATAT